jgi:hypothetical protein
VGCGGSFREFSSIYIAFARISLEALLAGAWRWQSFTQFFYNARRSAFWPGFGRQRGHSLGLSIGQVSGSGTTVISVRGSQSIDPDRSHRPFAGYLVRAGFILVNTIVGLRSVPDDLRDLMRSLKATTWQTLRLLEIPAALPVFLGGLRVGATLSVIGAVVGEFVGSDRGLGFMINRARGQYDTALVFVAVISLVMMALALYGSVVILESRLLSWQERPE